MTKKARKKEFIELKSTDDKDVPLRGYKLIGFNCRSNTGTIDLIITLWNYRMNKEGFFTIGGELSRADLKIPSDCVKSKSDFENNRAVGFFANKDVHAIGLLHDKRKLNPFSDFVLSKKQPSIKINEGILAQLKDHLIDLVVYGDAEVCQECKLFEKINNEFVTKKYILREFPKNAAQEDISLNRCAVESHGFIPEKFKLGNPTPGKHNDCSGPHFLLEDHIPSVVSEYCDNCDESEDQCSSTCNVDQPISSDDNNIIEQEIESANQTTTKDVCTSLMLYPDGTNKVMNIV